MKKIGLLSLMAVMGLFLSFCAKAATPTTDGKNPNEWESLPEYSLTDTSSNIWFKLNDGNVSEDVIIPYSDWGTRDKKDPLTVKTKSGDPFAKLEPVVTGHATYGDAIARFFINNNSGIEPSEAVSYHVYLNGNYIDTGKDPAIKDNLAAPNSTSNPYSYNKVLAMKAGDTLQIIADFTAKDGVHYKWTSPLLKFE